MDTTIVRVSSRRDEQRFLNLPWQLHRGDSNWVPPMRKSQRELSGFAKHPFYESAKSQAFLACRGKEAVGRVLAIDNPVHNRIHNEKIGFFGFFECVNEPKVAAALFDAALTWHQQQGMNSIRGPVNPSVNYECGLLVDGFDEPPTFLMTYNPRYYVDLIESYGFEKAQDLYTYMGTVEGMKSDNFERLAFMADKLLKRVNVKIRALNPKRMVDELRTFQQIYNRAFANMWGFIPLSDREITHFAADLRHLIVPTFASFAEVEGTPVGIQLGLLDFNPRIKLIDGKLFPFGFLRLLTGKKGLRRLRLVSTFVVPDFQGGKGIGPSLITRMVPSFEEWGIEELEFSWVAESNVQSRAALTRSKTAITKTHRIYDYIAT